MRVDTAHTFSKCKCLETSLVRHAQYTLSEMACSQCTTHAMVATQSVTDPFNNWMEHCHHELVKLKFSMSSSMS